MFTLVYYTMSSIPVNVNIHMMTCIVCDVKCLLLLKCLGLPSPAMAVDVLQFWSTWLCVGGLVAVSVQRSARYV